MMEVWKVLWFRAGEDIGRTEEVPELGDDDRFYDRGIADDSGGLKEASKVEELGDCDDAEVIDNIGEVEAGVVEVAIALLLGSGQESPSSRFMISSNSFRSASSASVTSPPLSNRRSLLEPDVDRFRSGLAGIAD